MNRTYLMLPLFKEFLSATFRNRRGVINGKIMTVNSKKNYQYLYRLLDMFTHHTNFELRVKAIGNNQRNFKRERIYYDQFYLKFTGYLFDTLGYFDNYVGHNIKLLKVFLKWVKTQRGINIGEFYQHFHVWKENIPIIAMDTDQLKFLIADEAFHESLTDRLRKSKDLFVFGCTVALRVGDLIALRKENLEINGGACYLIVTSQKTSRSTRIKLPNYAVEILKRNSSRSKNLFPFISMGYFNEQIKTIAEAAGWTEEITKLRTRRGIPVVVRNKKKSRSIYRFCDLVSTHTMRRTAITTMLDLGVEESTVRRISGHSPGSVEFYKYVKHNQKRIDDQTDKMFEALLN